MDKKLYIIKLIAILFLISIFFFMAGCDDSTEVIENQYQNSINILKEQVYTRNGNAKKISQVYLEYKTTGNYDIFAYTSSSALLGSGKIEDGILNFNISQIEEANLIDWEEFEIVFKQWGNVTCSTAIKCTMFLLYAYDGTNLIGILDRQRIIGTSSTITQETLMYIYVDNNCTIKGRKSSGYEKNNFYYITKNDLDLQLKKGWNLVTRTEKYSTDISGYATISMEIKPITNPQDYKWVMN